MTDFASLYGRPPRVVASAPGRVNLLGEHTDYNDGYVLPIATPQTTTVALDFARTEVYTAYAARFDVTERFTLDHPPKAFFASYLFGCIQMLRRRGLGVPPLDIHIESDLAMGAGLSSSAALEVAMLRALRVLLDLTITDEDIALMAQAAEIEYSGVQCGIMDQMASSLARPDVMLFLDTRTLERRLVPLPGPAELLVIDSGVPRTLAGSAYNDRRRECESAARLLGVKALRDITDPATVAALPEPLRQRARHVVTENARVLQAAAGTTAMEFGRLMNASHASLRDDYAVSTPALDRLVELLQAHAGTYGARLTGAGFGGACVALCHEGSAKAVATDVLQSYNRDHHGQRILPL